MVLPSGAAAFGVEKGIVCVWFILLVPGVHMELRLGAEADATGFTSLY